MENNIVSVADIHTAINGLGSWGCIYIPEFTYGDLRIDGILIEPCKKRIKGFEIKVSRGDFLQDYKWQMYSKFCSTLFVACPDGLIKPEEIDKPFGLLYISKNITIREYDKKECVEYTVNWVKKPKDFQGNKSLAWIFKYYEVVETEFKRLVEENKQIKQDRELSK
jgi:hypothetical protein